MNKLQTIQFLKNNHQKLEKVINRLEENQMVEDIISIKWTVKDILAHISAWNLELIKAIDDLLNNQEPWFTNEEELTEAEFNELETEKRKAWSLNQVLEEWQSSFDELISKIESLSSTEWDYQTAFKWGGEMPVSVNSLFEYTYKGEGHEGGHAKQIKDHYRKK
ncbi:MAG: DinB family protein [Promethearchaeota archaeon]